LTRPHHFNTHYILDLTSTRAREADLDISASISPSLWVHVLTDLER
jgi:hypothetical protein